MYLEEVPEVHEVSGEHEFLRLGDEAVGHEAEVLHQLGGAVNAGVHVQLGSSQQPQQQVVDLVEDHGGVGRQRQLPGRQVEGARGAEHLAERVAGDEGDEEVRRRWRKETRLLLEFCFLSFVTAPVSFSNQVASARGEDVLQFSTLTDHLVL